MLKKEVNEVIKQSLFFIVIVFLMPLLILMVSRLSGSSLTYGELFFFVFHVSLLIFSLFLGISLFSREMRDSGMEYLLTLPYSRLQLLAFKVFPRFLAAAAVFVLYILLLLITGTSPETSNTMPLLPTETLAFLCISLFIIGVPFAISRGGIVISGLAAFFGLLVYLFFIHLSFPTALVLKGQEVYAIHTLFHTSWSVAVPGYLYFSAVFLLLAVISAFIYAFKRFNLGPAREFIKRYLKVFVPIFIIVTVVSVVWALAQVWTPNDQYYLTHNQKLIESNYFSARIYDKNRVTEIDVGDFFPGYYTVEKGQYLYNIRYTRYDSQLVRLDLRDPGYGIKVMYNARGNAGLRAPYIFKDVVVFFEYQRRDYRRIYFLVILNPDTGEFKKIEVPLQLRTNILQPRLFGADETGGKRSWLVRTGFSKMNSLFRVWEDGTLEELGNSDWPPVYAEGMLITGNDNAIMFNELTAEGLKPIKKIPVDKGFTLYTEIANHLDQQAPKEFYGGIKGEKPYQWKKIFRLNLETLELNEIKPLENSRGFIHYAQPDNWYYTALDTASTWTQYTLQELYQLSEGKPVIIKKFDPLNLNWRKDFYGIFSTGMVVKHDGKTRVYTLPDLEEIQFKI